MMIGDNFQGIAMKGTGLVKIKETFGTHVEEITSPYSPSIRERKSVPIHPQAMVLFILSTARPR